MFGFGRERTPAVPAEDAAMSAQQSQVAPSAQPSNSAQTTSSQPDEQALIQAIRGSGVSRELLGHVLGLGYDLEAIYAYVRKHGPQKLATRVGFGAKAVAAEEQPRRSTGSATPTQQTATGGVDELIADGGLYALSAVLWLTNGLFTVMGVMALFPSALGQVIGAVVGTVIHIIISRIEYAYFSWRRIFSIYAVPLIGAIVLDVGTAHQGLINFAERFFPNLLGDLPTRTLDHLVIFQVLWARLTVGDGVDPATLPSFPQWWLHSLVVLTVAMFLAIGSERLMRRFRRGFIETWRLRYGTP